VLLDEPQTFVCWLIDVDVSENDWRFRMLMTSPSADIAAEPSARVKRTNR
jgi:hypothetical protein